MKIAPTAKVEAIINHISVYDCHSHSIVEGGLEEIS